MDHKYLSILFLFVTSIGFSQSSIDDALGSIAQNNKRIASAKQSMATKQFENRSGLLPENPFISADYMIGKPTAGGNQFDLLAAQSLEFPTVYGKRGNLASEQYKLLEIEMIDLRQRILLEAKLLIIEIIHLNKQKEILEQRQNHAELIHNAYEKKYNAEQISALEFNKSKIQLLTARSELRNISSQIKIKTEHLSELNGGLPLEVTESLYPVKENIPAFEVLEDTIEYYDPQLQILNQLSHVSDAKLQLSRAMALPNLEIGYRYQTVLGQTFSGAHFGISLPLWEHKNTIKAERARVELTTIEINEHETEHYYEIKELYATYENLKKDLAEYNAVINQLNSEEILNKSLELGEINFITYAMELNYFYNTYDQFSILEKEYHMSIARLYKYQL